MSDVTETNEVKPFAELEPIRNTQVAPAVGIGALALNFALKYHDINTVQDGTLYQQYKLEGRNMRDLQLDMVFETAIRIEQHLLATSERISKIVVDAVADGITDALTDELDGSADDGDGEPPNA